MYSSVHGVSGAIIMTACPDPVIGAGLAFISHFLWDYVGESSIGNTRKSATIEGALLLAFLISLIYVGSPLLAFLGWVLGNLPDIIDKPLRWIYGHPEWFSCHNGKGLFQYKGRKLGYPVKISLTKEQTLWFNIGSTIIWLLYAAL